MLSKKSPAADIAKPLRLSRDQTKHFEAQAKEAKRKIAKTEALLEAHSGKVARLNEELAKAQGTRSTDLSKELAWSFIETERLETELLEAMETLARSEDALKTH